MDFKKNALNITEKYLSSGKSTNSQIAEINANDEQLKRICELVNQNIYLAIFSRTKDKSNINFELADINKILDMRRDRNMDYETAPVDYRTKAKILTDVFGEPAINEKIAAYETRVNDRKKWNEANDIKNRFYKIAQRFQAYYLSEKKAANELYKKLDGEVTVMLGNGDSIDDLKKIAADYIDKELGLKPTPINELFKIACENLDKRKIPYKTGLTKAASERYDTKSSFFELIKNCQMAMVKMASFLDMYVKANTIYKSMEKVVGNG